MAGKNGELGWFIHLMNVYFRVRIAVGCRHAYINSGQGKNCVAVKSLNCLILLSFQYKLQLPISIHVCF